MLRRLILSTLITSIAAVGFVGLTPSTAQADDDRPYRGRYYRDYDRDGDVDDEDWEYYTERSNEYWSNHWNWYDRQYRPYYNNRYRRYSSPYYRSYPSYYYNGNPYNSRYYYNRNNRGFDYYGREGNSVRIGPLRFNWR